MSLCMLEWVGGLFCVWLFVCFMRVYKTLNNTLGNCLANWYSVQPSKIAVGIWKATIAKNRCACWQLAGWVTCGCITTVCVPPTNLSKKKETCTCFYNRRRKVKGFASLEAMSVQVTQRNVLGYILSSLGRNKYIKWGGGLQISLDDFLIYVH